MSEQTDRAVIHTVAGLGAEFERLVDERAKIQDAMEKIEAMRATNGERLLLALNKVKRDKIECGKFVVSKMKGRVTRTIVKELLVAQGIDPLLISNCTKVTEGSPFITMREKGAEAGNGGER